MLTNWNLGVGYSRNTKEIKKGFTLIELLAVIVILAIIALIATPIILNVINHARKSSAVDSAYGYIDAIEYQNQMNALDNKKYSGISDGENLNIENLNVKLKGKGPDEGTITIEKGKVQSAHLCISGYWVDYITNKAEVSSSCTPGVKLIEQISTSDISATLDSITIQIDAVEGTTITAKVTDSEGQEITGTVQNNKVIFSGLKAGKTYTYTITASDSSGNSTPRTGTVTTANFNNIRISEDNPNWTNKKTITITTEENLYGTGTELQYKIGTGNWTKYTSPFEISENTKIYARLKNGENQTPDEATTLTITKIDNSRPTSATFTHTETDTSVTVKATGEDNESHIGYYQFSKDNGTTWLPETPQTSDTYTFTGLQTGDKVNIKVRVINNTYRNELNSNNYLESAKEEVTVPKAKYTATFKNGNTTIETRQVEEGEAIGTLPTEGINVPDGYKLHWYTAANGQGTKITATSTMPSANTTYYAHLKEANIICKRVTDSTKLHTETCNSTSCSNEGYTINGSKNTTMITYGNAKAEGQPLEPGDAFDCKVSKTGGYTERFYYVSKLNGNSTSNIAVLMYYNNTKDGVADNSKTSGIAYASSQVNSSGPVTAVTYLPTVNQWNNIELKSVDNNYARIITNERGNELANPFVYKNSSNVKYAARLLTYNEVNSSCSPVNYVSGTGYFNNCNYLLENSQYSSSTLGLNEIWLETPYWGSPYYAWYLMGNCGGKTCIYNYNTHHERAVRPAIEVYEDELEF